MCWSSLISAQVRTRHIYELWNWSDAGCSHSLFGPHLEGPPGHFPSPFLQLFGIESFRSFLFLVRSGSVSRVTTTPLVYIFPPNITWSYYLTTFFGGERYGFCVRHCRFLFWRFYCFLCVFFFSLMIPRKDGGPDIFTTPFPLIIIKNKTVFFFFPARNEKKSEGGQPEETLGMVRKVIKYSMAPIMAPLS